MDQDGTESNLMLERSCAPQKYIKYLKYYSNPIINISNTRKELQSTFDLRYGAIQGMVTSNRYEVQRELHKN